MTNKDYEAIAILLEGYLKPIREKIEAIEEKQKPTVRYVIGHQFIEFPNGCSIRTDQIAGLSSLYADGTFIVFSINPLQEFTTLTNVDGLYDKLKSQLDIQKNLNGE